MNSGRPAGKKNVNWDDILSLYKENKTHINSLKSVNAKANFLGIGCREQWYRLESNMKKKQSQFDQESKKQS